MVSERYRRQRSIGTQVDGLDTEVSNVRKRGARRVNSDAITEGAVSEHAITNETMQTNSVDSRVMAPGAVNSEHLGVINKIGTDGDLTLALPEDGTISYVLGGGTNPRVFWSYNKGLEREQYTTAATDFDTILAPGTHAIAISSTDAPNVSNAPPASSLFGLLEVRRWSNLGMQMYFPYNSSEIWARRRYNDTTDNWTAWAEFAPYSGTTYTATTPSPDWNTLTSPGNFYMNYTDQTAWEAILNKPVNVNGSSVWRFGLLEVKREGSMLIQTYTPYASASSTWFRAGAGGGSTWLPWQEIVTAHGGAPRGRVFRQNATSAFSTSSTSAIVTGLNIAAPALSSTRMYRLHFTCAQASMPAGSRMHLDFVHNSALVYRWYFQPDREGAAISLSKTYVPPTTGAYNLHVAVGLDVGTGPLILHASTAEPMELYVEDIGSP